jgi:hypothetical protein
LFHNIRLNYLAQGKKKVSYFKGEKTDKNFQEDFAKGPYLNKVKGTVLRDKFRKNVDEN